jgi:glycerol uptake facilitator-like aquaporin
MFDAPVFSLSTHAKHGPSQLLSEFVSTFGLVGAVWICSRTRPSSVAGVVATYIGSAFWFTATDFANPAVTLARAFTDTFSGIRPSDVPGFIGAEFAGATAAVIMFRWLLRNVWTGVGDVKPTAKSDTRQIRSVVSARCVRA